MKLRSNGIIKAIPAADYSNYEGYGVTLSVVSGVLTATLSASATVPIEGIITEAGTVAQGVSVLIPGNEAGSCHVKITGAVTAGDKIQQSTDGSFVTDAGTGARNVVGLAIESGVSGDLIEVFPYTRFSAAKPPINQSTNNKLTNQNYGTQFNRNTQHSLTSYAQGLMQDRLAAYRLANLLCPIVQVGAAVGTFKIFDDRNDFLPVDMARPLGGPRARITHDATDGTYACTPFGVEIPVDDFEVDLAGGNNDGVASQLLEQGKMRTMVGKKATGYVKRVTDFVFANLTPVADRGQFSSNDIDPIDQIDEQLAALSILAGSTENMVVCLGINTWASIRRNALVKKRCGDVQVNAISLEQLNNSLIFPVKLEVSSVSYVSTKRGQSGGVGMAKTEAMSNYVVIANSFPNPTVDDPSPFKCFSTSSVLVDGVSTYREEKSASDVHFMDWSENIKSCGTGLARLLAVS